MITFHSDDYGLRPDNDAHLISLLRERKLAGISVLATMVSFESLQNLVRLQHEMPDIHVGLHINLIEGKPALDPTLIPTIATSKGVFNPLPAFMLRLLTGKIRRDDIHNEVDRQLNILREAGLVISILDSHQHTHAVSPVADVVGEIARAYEIPHIRSYGSVRTVSNTAKMKYRTLKAAAWMSHLAYHNASGMSDLVFQPTDGELMIMSWEDASFDIQSLVGQHISCIVHPGLGYDGNKSYEKLWGRK